MKNKFLLLLSPIAAMMFLYIFFAIGNWEFNLGKWSDECRSFYSILGFMLSVVSIWMTFFYLEDKK